MKIAFVKSSFVLVAITALVPFIFNPAFGADDEAVIQVKSIAEVDGKHSEITLGDLMVARGVSASAVESLKSVRLADTPNPGESRSFTAMGLEQVFRPYLRKIEDKTGEHINLRVPTRVTITRKSFRLHPEDVEADIKNQLKQFCADCAFEITALSLPAVPAAVPSGATWSVKIRSEIPKGSFSLPLEVANDDGSKRTYWISGTLVVQRKVPVAARAIQIGEHLRAEDFTMQSKDVTFSNDVPASEGELLSSVAARQLSAGQIVWRSNLRRELAVKSGDIVRVMAGEDGWQVSIDGIAQSGGYIGEMVKVKIQRTQKLISGILTEKGTVEVH
jgi:flagella basal body P-ring formation protein FlgA